MTENTQTKPAVAEGSIPAGVPTITAKDGTVIVLDRPPENKPSPAKWWKELGWRHIAGVVMAVYAIFPLVFLISLSLRPKATSLAGSDKLFSVVSFVNYSYIFTETQYPHWIANTLIIAGITALGTVLMGAAAAYAFSRFRFTGRRVTLTSLLVIQMFPQMLAFVAIFLLTRALGNVFPFLGMNSVTMLICIYLGGALGVNTFLMYGFFNTVPKEIDEAAKIDGATHGQIYWTIILRLVSPILAVVALLSFISSFSEYVLAKVIMQTPDKYTLAVGLYMFASDPQTKYWGYFAAGSVIAAIPVMALFLYLQKYIVSGLSAGAVKG